MPLRDISIYDRLCGASTIATISRDLMSTEVPQRPASEQYKFHIVRSGLTTFLPSQSEVQFLSSYTPW